MCVLPFDKSWLEETLGDSRPIVHGAEIADAALAIRCLDLTTLNGDDQSTTVVDLCKRAKEEGVAAVCVFPAFVGTCAHVLAGCGVAIATVAGGFPHGLSNLRSRVAEVADCAESGAAEIDVVIRREWVLTGQWRALYDEIVAMREAAGAQILKVILSTGELGSTDNVAKAAMTAMLAGADFVKTSTGKEAVNATLESGHAMTTAIREFHRRTGRRVGLKAAGGIRETAQALDWIAMVRAELGEEWLTPSLFRIGASSLLERLREKL